MNVDRLYKEFKKEHPETIGEKDQCFDTSNYKDWLELRVIELEAQLQVNDANTSNEKCTLHDVSKSVKEIELPNAFEEGTHNDLPFGF